MINLAALTSLFKGKDFTPMLGALQKLGPFLEHLEANYVADQDAKNALIDTAVQVLQAHKNVANPTPLQNEAANAK